MQLIVQFDTAGFDAWRADFDSHFEDRGAAGVSTLQIWRDVDHPGRAAVLLEVHDRVRANAWLKTLSALRTVSSAQFLETA